MTSIAFRPGASGAVTNTTTLRPNDPYTLDYAFPQIDLETAGVWPEPVGNRFVVQMARPRVMVRGLIMPVTSQSIERDNQMTGKVVSLGPLCFKDRTTFTPWPEGAWFAIGDFVRVPKYGGDRIRLPAPRMAFDDDNNISNPDPVEFVTFEETQALSVVRGNALLLLTFNG